MAAPTIFFKKKYGPHLNTCPFCGASRIKSIPSTFALLLSDVIHIGLAGRLAISPYNCGINAITHIHRLSPFWTQRLPSTCPDHGSNRKYSPPASVR